MTFPKGGEIRKHFWPKYSTSANCSPGNDEDRLPREAHPHRVTWPRELLECLGMSHSGFLNMSPSLCTSAQLEHLWEVERDPHSGWSNQGQGVMHWWVESILDFSPQCDCKTSSSQFEQSYRTPLPTLQKRIIRKFFVIFHLLLSLALGRLWSRMVSGILSI